MPARRILTVAVTVVALVVVVVGGLLDPDSDDVVLSERRDATPSPEGRVTDEQAAELRELVSPDRLRCEPHGCEAWRRDADDPRAIGVSAAGEVVLVDGWRIVTLDARSGELRTEGAIDVTRPSPDPGGPLERHVAVVEDMVVVTDAEGTVRGLELDGDQRWSLEPGERNHVSSVRAAGDRVAVAITRPASPIGASVVLLDAREGTRIGATTGRPRRLHDGVAVTEVTAPDGDARWCRAVPSRRVCWNDASVHPTPVDAGRHDDLLVVGSRRGDEGDLVVDTRSGEQRTEVDGEVRSSVTTAAGQVLVVDRGDGTSLAVGVDHAGQTLWRVRMPDRLWGRLQLALDASGEVIAYDREAPHVRVDPATGEVTDTSAEAAAGELYVGPGEVLVQRRTDAPGQGGSDTPPVTIHGRAFTTLRTEPLVVTDGTTILGIRAPAG